MMNLQSDNTSEKHSILSGVLINKAILIDGQGEQLECSGYRDHACKRCMYYLLCVLTLGFSLLLTRWKPEWGYYLTKTRCPLATATCVLLKDASGQFFTADIQTLHLNPGFNTSIQGLDDGQEEESYETESVTACLTSSQLGVERVLTYFDHHHERFVWDIQSATYKRLQGLDVNTKCSAFHDCFQGMSAVVQAEKLQLYRPNSIDIEVKSYWRLFIDEVLNPFYIFQVFSVALWFSDKYYYYAGCIIFISLISIIVSLYETRKQSVTLRDMVSMTTSEILVCRGNKEFEVVDIHSLVPGDVIAIPSHGCLMPCDAVLTQGNCIVNESMLTGESVPVTKTPLTHQEDTETYSPDEHKRHTLFAGTQVIQTRYYGQAKVLAVVIRTGFNTAKGELIRSILFPKPVGFKFYQDAMRFILFLGLIATVGMIYSIAILYREGVLFSKIVLRALDIITIVVPPALPGAMTVGMVYAQMRLKKQGIFCISPPRINFCGKLKLICFDKTGTLTEDGLDMWGVLPVVSKRFHGIIHEPSTLPRDPFLVCMATCHSLTMIDGELNGDPLDLKMFESINWDIEEPGEDRTRFDCLMPTVVKPKAPGSRAFYRGYPSYNSNQQVLEEPGQDTSKFETMMPTVVKPCTRDTFMHDVSLPDKPPFEVGIVRQFTFSSSMQRMSVIARILGQSHMSAYVKGAPEKIISLCKPHTVPENFPEVLHQYTIQGFRVIALAYREFDSKLTWHQAQRISRDKIEHDLDFLGLLIMRNTVKPETTPVIKKLRTANIRTVMVTGDNILTAISVARDCGMVQRSDRVILVNANPPDPVTNKEASILWQFAEMPSDSSASEAEVPPEATPFVSSTSGGGKSYHAVSLSDETEKYHFAVTGRSFAVLTTYFQDLMPKICTRGTIFARMSPEQKAQLVKQLQDLGYGVGMCGDGANDCMALKTAHAGISLSEAEASVASPFTSKTQNIECVPTVIREGRAALVTSFGCFKYMALYSMIQFASVLILYNFKTNLSDFMFLYVDLLITTTVAFLMGYTGAYGKLVARRPPGSLLKLSILLSIIFQVIVVTAFQVGSYFLIKAQPWFVPVKPTPSADNYQCFETTTIFYVSAFQYMTLAFAYSKGPPFRRRIWSNVLFSLSLVALVAFTACLMFVAPEGVRNFLKLKHYPSRSMKFKLKLVGYIAVNFVVCLFIEWIVESETFQKVCRFLRNKKKPKNRYKLVEKELTLLPDWPPVDHVTLPTSTLESSAVQEAHP
ncbi:polyamine-transporting ATPase 13A3-like [Liolophura sinensis]|uniref:polyamine-transporting ATPase 13A3-like n=1 Tax=Liolophura sinensis TaxID=3198878 RepID=UPI00315810C1